MNYLGGVPEPPQDPTLPPHTTCELVIREGVKILVPAAAAYLAYVNVQPLVYRVIARFVVRFVATCSLFWRGCKVSGMVGALVLLASFALRLAGGPWAAVSSLLLLCGARGALLLARAGSLIYALTFAAKGSSPTTAAVSAAVTAARLVPANASLQIIPELSLGGGVASMFSYGVTA